MKRVIIILSLIFFLPSCSGGEKEAKKYDDYLKLKYRKFINDFNDYCDESKVGENGSLDPPSINIFEKIDWKSLEENNSLNLVGLSIYDKKGSKVGLNIIQSKIEFFKVDNFHFEGSQISIGEGVMSDGSSKKIVIFEKFRENLSLQFTFTQA